MELETQEDQCHNPESEGLGTREADGISPSPRTEDRSPSSSRQAGSNGGAFLSLPFGSVRVLGGLVMPAHPREGHLPGPLTQLQASSGSYSQAVLRFIRS